MTFLYMLSFALLAVHGHAFSTLSDSFDMCSAVQDSNTRRTMANCFLSDNDDRCTNIATVFKSYLPTIVPTGCAECNQVQKEQFSCFLKAIIEKEPDLSDQLKKKYDPKGIYFEDLLISTGISTAYGGFVVLREGNNMKSVERERGSALENFMVFDLDFKHQCNSLKMSLGETGQVQ